MENLHFASHSFGCQVAAMTARNIKSQSNGKYQIQRLTALDPNVNVLGLDSWLLLTEIDAAYVEVYHSLFTHMITAPPAYGTVDIWINSPYSLQPACLKRG